MSNSASHPTDTTAPTTDKPVVHYEVQTDFGVMKFDSNSTLGFWWHKITNNTQSTLRGGGK